MLYSYDPQTQNLWRKLNNNEPELLGYIFAYRYITRVQKLKVIQANGKWIRL